uniref:Uncharacterized protein n=1 Tax=Rhizophora mucronata TaxID=61149 RepID=A0A2P2NKP4_RHIMU
MFGSFVYILHLCPVPCKGDRQEQ